MPTSFKGITLSSTCVGTIREWRDFVDLHTVNRDGTRKPISVKRCCEILLEDLSEQMRLNKKVMTHYWSNDSEEDLSTIVKEDWK